MKKNQMKNVLKFFWLKVYDYIFVMDNSNLYRINQIVDDNEHKVSLLLKDKVMKWNGDKLQHEMY